MHAEAVSASVIEEISGTRMRPGATVPKSSSIPPALSIYFDLLRLLAAVAVVLYHTWDRFFPASHVKWPGHEAVVIFFVLSGYVIAYTASRPGMTMSEYIRHRIARIVPVAWVALALALALALDKGALPIEATLVNMLFLGQAGFWWIEAPLNAPYWSLSYEVWYYAIFGAWLYAPRRYRKAAVLGALLLAGPKILLLFPVWLMGVWLYRKMPAMGGRTALAIYIMSLCAAAALCWLDVSDILRNWLYRVFPPAWKAHYSTQFLYDILLGLVVAAHFAAIAALHSVAGFLKRFDRPIRYLASFSFSLYVFHTPLAELFGKETNPVIFYGEMAFCVFMLGQLTERRVGFYRALLTRLFARSSSSILR
jgi:peptidoglycan/LPS O-acetylase OafA/YrhL